MSVKIQREAEGKVVHVRVSGKLTAEDYEQFLPAIEKLIIEHGKVRILLEMVDFHGWETAALWEDLKFDFKHFKDIERLDMVGDKAWQEGMSFFCKPFTMAKVRYYGQHELDRARQWVHEGIAVGGENQPAEG
ncbi:MAG: STAS/SEC14 domain-containing protein [Planctomycetota bacterium]